MIQLHIGSYLGRCFVQRALSGDLTHSFATAEYCSNCGAYGSRALLTRDLGGYIANHGCCL